MMSGHDDDKPRTYGTRQCREEEEGGNAAAPEQKHGAAAPEQRLTQGAPELLFL